MKRFFSKRTGVVLLWLLGIAVVGYAVYAWHPAIPPVEPPEAKSFDQRVIARGAQLAALGDCGTCHTTPGGETFAGGRAIPTPFGTVYSTNITPDPITGIGHWSKEAFQRALREGVDQDGDHLYPAFPYDHFTLINDADSEALYAYIMTRQPVQARVPENKLPFPLNMRFILAGWKLIFLHKGPYQQDSAHDEQWNQGAYLANGIGHCGACHTPHNSFGAEISNERFGGGEAEGWHAYAINADSQAYEDWNVSALHQYLRTGWHERHGLAHGPMAPVAQSMAAIPDADVEAVAAYVASVMTTRKTTANMHGASAAGGATNEAGAAIYSSACASCHDGSRPLPFGGIKLTLSPAVTGETSTNLINVILDGLHPPEGTSGAIMPGFSTSLTDGQLESLIAYIRSNLGAKPPWNDVELSVREARGHDRD